MNRNLIPNPRYSHKNVLSFPTNPQINTRKIDTTVITAPVPLIMELFPANPRRKTIRWGYQIIAGGEAFLYFQRSYEIPITITLAHLETYRNSSFAYIITSAAFTTGVLEQHLDAINNPVSLVLTGGAHRMYISEYS